MSLSVLETALELNARGFNVVPIGEGKRPPFSWKHLQDKPASIQEVYSWFSRNPQWGLGVLTGASSGNLLMVEIEGRAAQSEDALRSFAHSNGYGDVWERLTNGWVERTPSGGTHFYVRCSEPIEGNKKLARRPLSDKERLEHPGQRLTVLAETRGEGGLSVIAPTPGVLHPSGKPWETLRGSALTCPTFTPAEIEAVYSIFSSIDETPKVEVTPKRSQSHYRENHNGERLSTFDDYENRASWEDILLPAGWSLHHQDSSGTVYWTRPGKNPAEGISATTGYSHEADRLFVFSTSTEFDPERPYSKAQAYAQIHHGGNLSAAAKDLYTRGYGERFTPPQRRTYKRSEPRRGEAKPAQHRPYATQSERSGMALDALQRISASLRQPNPKAVANSASTSTASAIRTPYSPIASRPGRAR